ncbi:phosphate ABC transporter permease [Lusitaniella coriacea LEGE 07157]|uniref:Phosphate ABC transporter permease n=1 Tax=Lusitaniella coriacea LEGE 07157 TaxID=945747 RepID=A0A8J7AZ48_9CYAN|nr:phosphate ABC transporter permease [Lusitaniella coriacea]MBE9115319.1 phosphate ABC transporter permease [Lusitaniella coriacea LEGE 07157]
MLIPLTREKFDQLIPFIATGSQYGACWGKLRDFLRRLMISVVAVIVIWLLGSFLGNSAQGLKLLLGFAAGLYWLWSPAYWASQKNASYRRFQYSGFFRGRVLDVFVTDDLVGEEETVNNRGELVIVENRERRINVEVGDETGFRTIVRAPLQRIHKAIAPGNIAELVVLSNDRDLARITKISDIYIPKHDLWIGEYPYLAKDAFRVVSAQLSNRDPRDRETPRRRPNTLRRRR